MLENLLQKWASLAPRDRRMLIIAGCFLLVIIFWQVLLEPAWVGRQRLQKTLPTLRADLAQMVSWPMLPMRRPRRWRR